MKVLLIEGRQERAGRIRNLLQPIGVRLIESGDGLAGLGAAEVHEPDLILVDSDLPRMTGLDTVRVLKAMPKLAGVPIVMLAASPDPATIREAVDAEVEDLVLVSDLQGPDAARRLLKRVRVQPPMPPR